MWDFRSVPSAQSDARESCRDRSQKGDLSFHWPGGTLGRPAHLRRHSTNRWRRSTTWLPWEIRVAEVSAVACLSSLRRETTVAFQMTPAASMILRPTACSASISLAREARTPATVGFCWRTRRSLKVGGSAKRSSGVWLPLPMKTACSVSGPSASSSPRMWRVTRRLGVSNLRGSFRSWWSPGRGGRRPFRGGARQGIVAQPCRVSGSPFRSRPGGQYSRVGWRIRVAFRIPVASPWRR